MRFSTSLMALWRSLVAGGVLLLAHSVGAEEGVLPDPAVTPEELGQFLLERMQASREKLKSGVFQADRVWILKTPESEQSHPGEHIFCAFDFEKDLLRFDNESSEGFRYFTTSTEARLYTSSSEDNPNDWFAKVPPHFLGRFMRQYRLFDVRLAGICSHGEFEDGSFEDLMKFHTKECTATGKPLEGNRYLLILSYQHVNRSLPLLVRITQYRQEYVLDASRDFVPIKFTFRMKDFKSKQWESLDPPVTAEWKKNEPSDVYVPVKLRFPERWISEESLVTQYTFKWKSVNQPVDQKLFTEDGLKVPPGTEVEDLTRRFKDAPEEPPQEKKQ